MNIWRGRINAKFHPQLFAGFKRLLQMFFHNHIFHPPSKQFFNFSRISINCHQSSITEETEKIKSVDYRGRPRNTSPKTSKGELMFKLLFTFTDMLRDFCALPAKS